MIRGWVVILRTLIVLLAVAGLPLVAVVLPQFVQGNVQNFPEFAYLEQPCIAFGVAMALCVYVAAGAAWWFLGICDKTYVFGPGQNRPLTVIALCATAFLALGMALFAVLAVNGAANGAVFLHSVPVGLAALAVIGATRLYRHLVPAGDAMGAGPADGAESD